MKTRYVILITVAATLVVESMLLRWWFTRDMILSWVEPGSNTSVGYVLTQDVVLRDHQGVVGGLQAGQRLFLPCRHDLFLTEPFDPSILKVYVEFSGTQDMESCLAWQSEAPRGFTMRNRLYLGRKGEGTSEQTLGSDVRQTEPNEQR